MLRERKKKRGVEGMFRPSFLETIVSTWGEEVERQRERNEKRKEKEGKPVDFIRHLPHVHLKLNNEIKESIMRHLERTAC